jgi:alkylation response protein AidB-like acyl-CoA dehydrogenase
MKLDLTPEQAFFHGTTRQFLDDKVPTSLVRELRNDPAGFGRDFWRQGADLGWTSLLVPEADGGGPKVDRYVNHETVSRWRWSQEPPG